MTTREIRTERVVQRSISPHHHQSNNLSSLDNNLDNLLEDLQNSVSGRPINTTTLNGSGIHGGNYRNEYTTTTQSSSMTTKRRNETLLNNPMDRLNNNSSSSRMVEYRSAANPIIVPSESTESTVIEKSRDGNKEKTVYKTMKYEYDVSDSIIPDTTTVRMQSNINQLDSLLDDLQQARKGTAGIDSGLLEDNRQTKKTVQRELVTTKSTSGRISPIPTSVRRSDREGSVTREVTYTIDDGTYGDIRQHHRQPSPQRTTQTIEKQEYINSSILNDLDPHLLPNANTKVTTTIKTYTYELPGTVSPQPPPPPSTTSTINRNELYEYRNENYHKVIPQSTPPTSYERNVYHETNHHVPSQRVTEYSEDVRTTNKYGEFVAGPRTPTSTRKFTPSGGRSPTPGHDINYTYQYKSEQTTNRSGSGGGYPPSPSVDHRQPGKFPTDDLNGPPKRLDDLMASFGQKSSTNYTHNDESKEPLLKNNKNVAGSQLAAKKDFKDMPKTRNVAGPPVYYPPGHEMFAKKEESGAAYRAQGGYAKGSGRYEYEAESKSKTKSKSGAAVVPVCLPLCCAMPCTIL